MNFNFVRFAKGFTAAVIGDVAIINRLALKNKPRFQADFEKMMPTEGDLSTTAVVQLVTAVTFMNRLIDTPSHLLTDYSYYITFTSKLQLQIVSVLVNVLNETNEVLTVIKNATENVDKIVNSIHQMAESGMEKEELIKFLLNGNEKYITVIE